MLLKFPAFSCSRYDHCASSNEIHFFPDIALLDDVIPRSVGYAFKHLKYGSNEVDVTI